MELLEISKNSSERDAKIETSIAFMEKRLEAMEELTAKMSETLNEQKHLSSVVDSLAVQVNDVLAKTRDNETRIKKII